MKNYILAVGLFIILSGFISAVQVCEVYDDFSSGNLSTDKWQEVSATIDEHFVSSEVYHTAQLIPADRQTTIEAKRIFLPGDILEYDVNYSGGNGNRIHRAKIDGIGYALFGFWNSVADGGVGNEFGLYHVKITFTEQGLTDEITLPNGTITHTRPDGILPSPGIEHTYGLTTRTGHNGVVHMDYDNVVVCSEELKPNLEQRVAELESRVSELENRTTILESLLDKIMEFIDGLPRGLRKYHDRD